MTRGGAVFAGWIATWVFTLPAFLLIWAVSPWTSRGVWQVLMTFGFAWAGVGGGIFGLCLYGLREFSLHYAAVNGPLAKAGDPG